jgi:hypothetical protein
LQHIKLSTMLKMSKDAGYLCLFNDYLQILNL